MGEDLKSKVYGIYIRGLDADAGFYAREAEESGLMAVYEAGFNAGQQKESGLD